MILVVPGIVLAAAYNLRMLQRVAYGGTNNPDHSTLKDLTLREVVTLDAAVGLCALDRLEP
jgi:NADH-quinone oxidoreductase subunit M